jgi:hypothetical protein
VPCQISGGATVTIKPGRTLTIVNDVKVNGTLIFEDRASLVQINDGAVNSGNITYKRQTKAISNLDFTIGLHRFLLRNYMMFRPIPISFFF